VSPDFTQADFILGHLDGLIDNVVDDFLKSRYTGFVSVVAVTAFETNIRAKLISFCSAKHKVFGAFSEATFEKTNARIRLDNLRKDCLSRFGQKYLKRFNRNLDNAETQALADGLGSLKGSYHNIVQWRHDFVHDGIIPAYAGYVEARTAYENGKRVVQIFFDSLNR
jgi:hypothetical protein